MNYSEALERQVALLRSAAAWPADSWERSSLLTLGTAETLYLGGQIGDVLWQAAESFPDSTTLDRDDLPWPSGFVWMESPHLVQASEPGRAQVVAVEWNAGQARLQKGEGVELVWGSADEAKARANTVFLTIYGRAHPAYPVVPLWRTQWNFGASISTDYGNVGPDWTEWDDGAVLTIRRFMGAFFGFIRQRILVSPHERAERHARKRLEREGWTEEPLIRVVQLRRREGVGTNPNSVQPTEHEYHCQWVVRGHWRQQWYPKAQRNQPIWITPYVKGPEDKPLKAPRATVFAVVR